MNVLETSSSLEIFGRQAQFQQITQALARDADLLITGVPGSGRRTLVRRAAQEVGAKTLDIDCIRATNSQRFVQLLCEGINKTFKSQASHEVVDKWLSQEGAELFEPILKNPRVKNISIDIIFLEEGASKERSLTGKIKA